MKNFWRNFKYSTAKQLTPEFWPMVRFYAPTIPVYLYFAFRRKHWAYFTNVNPAIPFSGLFGESKSEILDMFPAYSKPATLSVSAETEFSKASHWITANSLTYPIVAKPNIGERGNGVVFLQNESELKQFLKANDEDYLLQEFINYSEEYGIFIAKSPVTGKVKVLSITGKQFLSVTGNGKQTVKELLSESLRGWLQVARLEKEGSNMLSHVPFLKEEFTIGRVGNHCLGTTFLDRNALNSPALERYLTTMFKDIPGIHYGRLDLKCNSISEMLVEGKFSILEFNGVSSEPGLAFDPSYTLFKSYKTVINHLRVQHQISKELTKQGVLPETSYNTFNLLGEYHKLTNLGWFKAIKKLLAQGKDHTNQLPIQLPALPKNNALA